TLPIQRPRLRPVETILVPDAQYGQAVMLRDTEGVTSKVATIPAPLIPVVARFAGLLTVDEIADIASRETGAEIPVAVVPMLAEELDKALFLDGPRYQAERKRVEEEFTSSPVRPATHAGGAYHADPTKLRAYLEQECIGVAGPKEKNDAVRGLV